MIEPRLTSEFQISALRRLVEADGGSATILRKGDASAGSILLIGQVRGRNPILFDRYPSLTGEYSWQSIAASSDDNEAEVAKYWTKRASLDPDLWVLELDVASKERLSRLLGTNS